MALRQAPSAQHAGPQAPLPTNPALCPPFQMRVEVYVSFGGLLLQLVGDPKKMERLEVDSCLYLLMKRVD